MARVPTAGQMITSPKDPDVLKAEEEQRRKSVEQMPGAAADATYTLVSGAIKPVVGIFAVDTEGAAASDDLTTLTGDPDVADAGFPGHGVVLLRAADTARTVVVKHQAGGSYDISLATGADFSLDDDRKSIALELRGTRWYEIDRDYGEDQAAARAALGVTKVSQLTDPAPGDEGRFVGAASGNVAWTEAPFGGDDFMETSLQHPGSARVYASGSPVRFEDVDLGTPDTDSYQFNAPIGATLCRVQCLAQLERQNENADYDFATLKVASKIGSLFEFDLYDQSGLNGARGLPARSVFFRPNTEDDRLRDPYIVLASSVVTLLAGRAIRVQVNGKSTNSYRVKGTRPRTWLSLQWI